VGCVERAGSNLSRDISPDEKGSERQLRQITMEIKSDLIRRLGAMNLKEDVLIRLEERLNQRMEDVLAKMWLEWTTSQSVHGEQKPAKRLTLLETLEYSVRGDEELEGALAVIRSKVEAQEIDECDFRQIYEEIGKQEKSLKAKQDDLPAGIMRSRELLAIIDKEIARAKRYGTPFSALGFSLVKAKPKNRPKPEQVSKQEVIDAVLRKLSEIFRSSDVVGQMKANRLVALLPMTHEEEAKLALRRAMRLLHLGPVHVQDIPFEVKVAGVVVDMDVATANALQFGDTLSVQLTDMATRISNIHVCSS
jgi:GGDEF domain-containing protein